MFSLVPFRKSALRPSVALTLFGLALAAVSAPITVADAQARGGLDVSQITIAPNLSHFTLENGLEVVVIPDRRAPVATHMLWYKVGSADEPEGQSGVAHFLEHLMFKGTSTHPNGAFSKLIADIGGRENAFTSLDYTAYFQRVGKEHLPAMMEMEADRMHNLVLTDEVVAPERDVVLEERRSRVDANPGSRLREAMDAIMFVNHPYGSPVIGWESEIKALNKDAALAFYDRFYTPNNAVLIVAGDVESDEVLRLAENTYGKVPRRAEPGARLRPAEPPLQGTRRIELEDPRVRQERFSQVWMVPSSSNAESVTSEALDVLSYVLGGSSSSRLYTALVLDREIALSAGSYYQATALDDSRFAVFGSPKPGTALPELEQAIARVIDVLLADGISEDELARAKHAMVADAVYAQDSQTSLARIFGAALTTGSTVEDVQSWPQRIQQVTAEDVKQAARQYLTKEPVIGYLKMPKQPGPEANDASAQTTKERS